MEFTKVKIVTFAPVKHADDIRRALGSAGAGQIGEYSFCSYSVLGNGRYVASLNAKPYVGDAGMAEIVEEERIEVVCERSEAKKVIAAMKLVHPYEEVAFDIYPLISEEDI